MSNIVSIKAWIKQKTDQITVASTQDKIAVNWVSKISKEDMERISKSNQQLRDIVLQLKRLD